LRIPDVNCLISLAGPECPARKKKHAATRDAHS